MTFRVPISAALLLFCTGPIVVAETEIPVERLLDGVSEIAAPGVPGSLCVAGPAEAIVAGRCGDTLQPMAAATTLGKGRVLALGHEGYFWKASIDTADTRPFLLNAIRWAAGGNSPNVMVVRAGDLAACAKEAGFESRILPQDRWAGALAEGNVLVLDVGDIRTNEQASALSKFVHGGGGLLIGSPGWGWLQLHPGRTLEKDHPGNRLLRGRGIVWAGGTVSRTGPEGFAVERDSLAACNANRALEILRAAEDTRGRPPEGILRVAARTLQEAAVAFPQDDPWIVPQLEALLKDSSIAAVPTPAKPLRMEDFLARTAVAWRVRTATALPAREVRGDPAAAHFPGKVPAGAERISRTIAIDTKRPDWHGTGLYAAPGEPITVEIPDVAAGKEIAVQIGSHTDRLWEHPAWRRAPQIVHRVTLTESKTQVASAFGGLVYLVVPNRCPLEPFEVTVSGAIESPRFKSGETDDAAWRKRLSAAKAPWAELEGEKVILTIPSAACGKLENPTALMRFWDSVLDACADLATLPRERDRPERIVADEQISAGYMHSGYPIMTHLDVAETLVDLERIKSNGHGGVWGFFHEIGHNHQSPDWTFDGTGEVTVNLFTMYVYDTLLGGFPQDRRLESPAWRKEVEAYFREGAAFEQWKNRPFLALVMYMQLQEAFGWDAYKRVFAEYRSLPRAERPRTDAQKRDQWMIRFSRTVNRDLGPFFRKWDIPVSQEALDSTRDLPPWMPEGIPAETRTP